MLNSNSKRQKGMTLIEVLVAAIILGVGMLGILTLQTQSVQFNHQAYLKSQAIFLMGSIVDKMRSNSDALGSYVTGYYDDYSGVTDNCETATCTSSALASWDLMQWKADVARALPAGVGEIVNAGGTTFAVRIRFEDPRIDSDPDVAGIQPTTEQYSVSVQL
jgi:type IV pilus assembly protein PilV